MEKDKSSIVHISKDGSASREVIFMPFKLPTSIGSPVIM
jgi:hypothetical protein